VKRDPSDTVVVWLVIALSVVLVLIELRRIAVGLWRLIP